MSYIGFLILMGINKLPDLYDCWSLDPMLHCDAVASRISRKRFMEFKSFLHFVDNNLAIPYGQDGYDCLVRIRPILSLVNFKNHYNSHKQVSVDESMINLKVIPKQSSIFHSNELKGV
jgi:hypothetical protein